MRLVLASFVGLWVVGCAHTVTNEQRLDELTSAGVESDEPAAAELRCRDTTPEIQLARDGGQRKAERLARYASALKIAKATTARFEEAFRKDPDLVYGPGADEWKRKQQGCVDLIATLEREQTRVDIEVVEASPPPRAAEKLAPVVEAKPRPAPVSAADEAFEDDTVELRSKYKTKAKSKKVASKSKKKKRGVSLAARD